MTNATIELVEKLNEYQEQIWESVAQKVKEFYGKTIQFTGGLTVTANAADFTTDMAGKLLVVQFAFSEIPDRFQQIILSEETFLELVSLIKGEDIKKVDELIVSEIRPLIEAILQGICLALGQIKKTPVTVSGVTTKIQGFNIPESLKEEAQILRTTVRITSEQLEGTLTWLTDTPVAVFMLEEDHLNEAQDSRFKDYSSISSSSDPEKTQLNSSTTSNIGILLDVPLEISVELGRARMIVKEVIELGAGSIIEIDKAAGEPVDILVNNRLVAKGEVVVIEDNFGVRITEILTPNERIAKLSHVA
jgi:flagellar motor switch protein FliN/FliY